MNICKMKKMISIIIISSLLSIALCGCGGSDISDEEISALEEYFAQSDSEADDESDSKSEEEIETEKAEIADNETLFYEYISSELILKYGLSKKEQSTSKTSMEDTWLNPEGILAAKVYDLDNDGEDECIVFRFRENSEYEVEYYENVAVYNIVISVYEIDDGAVVMTENIDYVGFDEDYYTMILNESEWCEIKIYFSIINIDSEVYIICEYKDIATAYADGKYEEYVALEYNDSALKTAFAFIQTGGGSSDFEYTGYIFENGEIVDSTVLLNEWYLAEGGETGPESEYDTYEGAMEGFFGEYDIEIADDVKSYDISNSILSENNNIERIFCYQVEYLDEESDFVNNIQHFEQTLTDYTDLESNLN